MKWNTWRIVLGVLFIVLGGVWLWNNLDIGPRINLGALWPLMLIALGAYMIWRQANPASARRGGAIDRILGDIRLGGPGWQVQNSDIFTIIGDVDIDLRQSVIPEGETTIHTRAVIGDIDVVVPAGVAVSVGASIGVGEARVLDVKRDGFLLDMSASTPDYATARRKVRIEVDMLVGDIQITRTG